MDNLILLVPLAVTLGHCLVSTCLFRKLTSRITFLEERVATLTSYPPPPPPYYPSPPGYGYAYSGQGNLNVI